MSEQRSVLRSAGVVGVFTLISRLLGLVRDIIQANLLGTGFWASAFAWAFRIPNMLRRLLGEGALSSAFIPVFVEAREKNDLPRAQDLMNVIITFLTIVLVGLTVIGYVICLLVYGYSADGSLKAVVAQLLFWMLPFMTFICIIGVLGGILNAVRHFSIPAVTPAVFNVCLIIPGLYLIYAKKLAGVDFDPTRFQAHVATVLSIAVLISGLVQLAIHIPPLRARGLRFKPLFNFKNPDFGRVMKAMLPIAFGLGIFQINVLMDWVLAQILLEKQGAVAVLYFSDRIMQFPLALFSIAVATAVFPALSRQAAVGDMKELTVTANYALRQVMFMTIPSTIGIAVLSRQIVELFLQTGQFDADSTARTAPALLCLILGLGAYSGVQIMTRTFYALKDTSTPVRIGVRVVTLNFCLNIILIKTTNLQEAALCLATTLSSTVNLVIMTQVLRKKIGLIGGRELLRTFIKCLVAGAVLGAVCFGTLYLLPAGAGRFDKALRVFIPILAGSGAYFLAAYVLKMKELSEALSILRRRKQKNA